jgi:FixJ family two-component response regulator
MIAVVDDDSSLREAVSALLSAYGYQIDAYSSGHELLGCGKLDGYAGFILDVNMPGLDGLQLQEGLLAEGIRAPVIFLTSAADRETRDRAMATGAFAFLGKPFQGGELLAQIERAIGTAPG